MPTQLTCEDFGLTQEQMLDRLINTMADRLLDSPADVDQSVIEALNARIRQQVSANIESLFNEHVLGKVDELLTNLVIPHTNRYGEETEDPQTLIEYVTAKAETYLREDVNHKGQSRSEDRYSWTKHSTRLMYAVNSHLKYELDRTLEKAAADVNDTFAKSVQTAVADTLESLKVSVKATVKR